MAFVDPVAVAWRAVNPHVPPPDVLHCGPATLEDLAAEGAQRAEEARQRKLKSNRRHRRPSTTAERGEVLRRSEPALTARDAT
jgi:hypothetical protein